MKQCKVYRKDAHHECSCFKFCVYRNIIFLMFILLFVPISFAQTIVTKEIIINDIWYDETAGNLGTNTQYRTQGSTASSDGRSYLTYGNKSNPDSFFNQCASADDILKAEFFKTTRSAGTDSVIVEAYGVNGVTRTEDAGDPYSNQPCGAAFDDATDCNLSIAASFVADAVSTTYNFTATALAKRAFSEDWNNISVVIKSSNEAANNLANFEARESGVSPSFVNITCNFLEVTFGASILNNTEPKENEFINISANATSATLDFSGYIFSWDNGTGTFVNDSFVSLNPTLFANFSVVKQVESSAGTVVQFQWFLNISDGTFHSSSIESFIVENVSLDDCTDFNVPTLNFSFFDEINNSIVSADSDSTFNYQFEDLIDKQLILDENDRISFDVCINPEDITLTGDYRVLYGSTVYPQRRFHDTDAIYNNQKQTINLFLLESAQGIFIRFRVQSSTGLPLSGAKIIMQRIIAGQLTTVEIQLTDDSGIATFFSDPDSDYTFIVSLDGFVPQTFTLRPTTTEITQVTLLAIGQPGQDSIDIGTSYFFEPIVGTLNNNTNVNFTFNMTSSFRKITGCTLFLKNETTTLSKQSGTFNDTQCTIRIEFNTGTQNLIVSQGQWELNGTFNATASVQYSVISTYVGEFSLQTLINDITAFGESGFNDFTRFVFALIGIFIVVGIATGGASGIGGFGIRDDEQVLILIWTMVLFFSFIGWMNLNIQSIPEIRGVPEGYIQQYAVFILTTLFTIGALMRKQ